MQPVFDQQCLFIHRLKQRSAPNYKVKLAELSSDASNPHIFQLAKELSDASDNYNNQYFSQNAKDLDKVDLKELVDATNNYLSLLGGFVGNTLLENNNNKSSDDNNDKDDSDSDSDSESVGKTNSINEIDDDIEVESSSSEQKEKEKDSKKEKKQKKVESSKSSKEKSLRYNLYYQWSTIAGSERVVDSNDALLEIGNVIFNQSVWYMGYSQFLVGKNAQDDGLNDEVRNVVYDCLLRAAGGFEYIRTKLSPLMDEDVRATDLSDSFLRVLYLQAVGQAQELTIGRACKKNTSTNLICKIAVDTANIYQEAQTLLTNLGSLFELRLEKLSVFLNYKHSLYQSLSYYLNAFTQNATHKYGDAIVSGQQALFNLKNAKALLKACVSNTITLDAVKKPTNYLYNILDTEIPRFERENKVIGYQTVPEEVSALPDANRLAKPRDFVMPATNALWDDKINASFNYNKKLSMADISPLAIQNTPKLESANDKDAKEDNTKDDDEKPSSSSSSSNTTTTTPKQQPKKTNSSGGCTIN
ncbi:hypothetical protein PPL_10128 [Heterostelium album PN500]|uniref:BRO1 domain-containing protein n=1 Tax=Heterostelium pallidum (strain ATCC 26659 / Pp 5 / PN500) TaxID=670386 RepID=D3BQE3_HETP5|nr:hypothetical protein PPL_10128 [Heterostelium album PN500]EFA76363.1 hypothetical protein PPL_10128 [Heterostelium album PN500]|eukprot:XP_020428495.1 hypothetical protein PPL_10128 [Heterostelium album PN500]